MKTSFKDLINGDAPVLIDFYADWCQPCKMMAPILQEVKQNLGDDIKIVKIDTDKNREISSNYGIRSIPTLMLFKNGKVVWKQAGVVPAQQLTEILKSQLN